MLEERAGGEGADYAIRTLQSKDKLTQLVTMKDPVSGQLVDATVHGAGSYRVSGDDDRELPEPGEHEPLF